MPWAGAQQGTRTPFGLMLKIRLTALILNTGTPSLVSELFRFTLFTWQRLKSYPL